VGGQLYSSPADVRKMLQAEIMIPVDGMFRTFWTSVLC
jgi:hypothetical protein